MATTSEIAQYLQTTETIDYNDSLVNDFAEKNVGPSSEHRERAIKLYRAVRDGIRYDPYTADLSPESFRAGEVLRRGRGWCVPKSILLAACCRKMGIPARLGFADVKNHLSTKRMRENMKTDIFFWHGYTSIYLDGVWLKVTPAFNKELCERFDLKPLDFNGRADALFQPFDSKGNKYMEYLRYHGEFADVPIDLIRKTFEREYPDISLWNENLSFDNDVDREFQGSKISAEYKPK